MGFSLEGHKESDMTEVTELAFTHRQYKSSGYIKDFVKEKRKNE